MRQTNGYIIGFAAAICVVCSLALSVVSGSLRERQEQNRVLDRQKNILKAVGYAPDELASKTAEEVQRLYGENFEEVVVDGQGSRLEVSMNDLAADEASGESALGKRLPLYRQKAAGNPAQTLAYVYPVAGKGLWSTMYGYVAVKPDGNEIIGMAFYKHGETPGLGGEIEKTWFTDSFRGKQLYSGAGLEGVEVVKGKVADNPAKASRAQHAVDGISGATLTGNGVTKMMKAVPSRYAPFFAKARASRTAMWSQGPAGTAHEGEAP